MSYIIAVASPIGGGKTSLVKEITRNLENAAPLYFDHFQKVTERSVTDLVRWMNEGADFNEFKLPELSDALQKLKQGTAAISPLTQMEIPPADHIIFEMPLGKEHAGTARFIDLLIWIELPLDIAFARKVKEYTGIFLAEHGREIYRCVAWLDNYLLAYLNGVRDVLELQRQKVSARADIVIDGRGDVETMSRQAVAEIRARIS